MMATLGHKGAACQWVPKSHDHPSHDPSRGSLSLSAVNSEPTFKADFKLPVRLPLALRPECHESPPLSSSLRLTATSALDWRFASKFWHSLGPRFRFQVVA